MVPVLRDQPVFMCNYVARARTRPSRTSRRSLCSKPSQEWNNRNDRLPYNCRELIVETRKEFLNASRVFN